MGRRKRLSPVPFASWEEDARRLQEEDEAIARRLQEEEEALALQDETGSLDEALARRLQEESDEEDVDGARLLRQQQDAEYEAMEEQDRREEKRRRLEMEEREAAREAKARRLADARGRLEAWRVETPVRARAVMPWGVETVAFCRSHSRDDVLGWLRDRLVVERDGDVDFSLRVQRRNDAGQAEDWEGQAAEELCQSTLIVTATDLARR